MGAEKHVHNFKRYRRKVTLLGGLKRAYDILIIWKCKCGEEKASDIAERTEI